MTREIGVRYLDLGYLEFRLKRQGKEDGRKQGRWKEAWKEGNGVHAPAAMLERGTRGQPTGEKKSEQSHSRG